MVLIFTLDIGHTTDRVIGWLNYFKVDFIRINSSTVISVIEADINRDLFIFEVHGIRVDLSDVSCFWYRRGGVKLSSTCPLNTERCDAGNPFERALHEELFIALGISLIKENTRLREYFIYKLEKLPSINKPSNSDLNKLIVLDQAKRVGFNIPMTKVLARVSDIRLHYQNNLPNKLITKAIAEGVYFIGRKNAYYGYTELVTPEIVESLDNQVQVLPSLLQNAINKDYELRIFYLMNECFAIAQHTQELKDTVVDSRKTHMGNPVRTNLVQLPTEVTTNINKLMNCLSLTSGSIDMIVDKDGTYWFLEVNPIGQFIRACWEI